MLAMSLPSRLAAAWRAWSPAASGPRRVVEGCAAFRRVAPQLGSPDPVDHWQVEELHYLLYRLRPDSSGRASHALFIVHAGADTPLSAVVVIPGADGGPSETVDLLRAAPQGGA